MLVLVGDDGSDAAARAVTWARAFAAERKSPLVAIRVVSALDDHHQDPAPEPGLEHITVSDRYPAVAIMELATDRNAGLVVLGRRGAGGFPSLPIGTTAHVVAGCSGRPVAIVPPFHRSRSRFVERVVVGVDALPGSRVAQAWAARVFPEAHFSAVHALDVALGFAHGEHDDRNGYERAYEAVDARMRDEWCAPLRDAGVSFEARAIEGAPAEVLLETAQRAVAGVVVIGRREHGALQGTLGGVSQRVLAYSSCPAIVVPSMNSDQT